MINATQYCKDTGVYRENLFPAFRKLQRVKPFVTKENFVSKHGRYGGCVMMSADVFDLFKMWVNRMPLPLINRQEKDMLVILKALFPDLKYQYKYKEFIYDFYIPSRNLLIEYDENHHRQSREGIVKTDTKAAQAMQGGFSYHLINERKMPDDLASLISLFYSTGLRYALPKAVNLGRKG